uniref:C3H1-type domain-containing protein n=1 Tax=Alexandrium monilatum TaxID=311494 RepID=A0A7S4W7C0_9DINO
MTNWREPMMTAPAGLSKKMGCFQAVPVPEVGPRPSMIGETPPATPQSTNGFHYAVTTPTSVPSYSGALINGGMAYTPLPRTPTPFTQTPTPTTPDSASVGNSAVVTAAPGLQEQLPLWNATRAATSLDEALAKVAWEQVTDEVGEADNDGDSDEDSDDAVENDTPLQLRNPEDAPKPPPGALHPSIGSEGHALGCCKRCCFFPRGRCANGYECEFCHYEHDKRKRKNKKKRTIRARQGFGNGSTRLLLAKELMRSSASQLDLTTGRQVITVPAAAMEQRPGAPMTAVAQTHFLLQAAGAGGAAAFQHPGGAAQVPTASLAAWLAAAPSQQFLGYCQAADAGVPRTAQLTAAGIQAPGQQQQLLVYGNAASGTQQLTTAQIYGATATAPTQGVGGTAAACPCPFGPTDSVQVLFHSPQQPASHMIMLPPAMSQAASQGPPALPAQRFCEPPPPPVQSPRLQRILGLSPGMAAGTIGTQH